MELRDKTILITGATSGIGKALAIELLERNNRIIAVGRNLYELMQLKEKGAFVIDCDLNELDQIPALVQKIKESVGHIDVFFNNAGIQYNYLLGSGEMVRIELEKEIKLNLLVPIFLIDLVLENLRSKKLLLVNTTSALGAFPKQDGLVYSATKAGLRNLTKGLYYSYKKQGIHIVDFIPPVTDTAMTRTREESKMCPAELVKKVLPQIEKERRLATIPKIRFFLLLSQLFPEFVNRLLNKK